MLFRSRPPRLPDTAPQSLLRQLRRAHRPAIPIEPKAKHKGQATSVIARGSAPWRNPAGTRRGANHRHQRHKPLTMIDTRIRALPRPAIDQVRQRQQVPGPERTPPRGHRPERILGHHIRPRCGDPLPTPLLVEVKHHIPTPTPPPAHEHQDLPGQRVERVGHPHQTIFRIVNRGS